MKVIEGIVTNEGNGRVGGKYCYVERKSRVEGVEIVVPFDNKRYCVSCDLNFTCKENRDDSVAYYNSEVICNEIKVKSVAMCKESDKEDLTDDIGLVKKITQLMNEENYLKEIADVYNDEAWKNIEE